MRLLGLLVVVLLLTLTPASAYLRLYHPEGRYPGYNGYGAPMQGPFGPYYVQTLEGGGNIYVTPGGWYEYDYPGFRYYPYVNPASASWYATQAGLPSGGTYRRPYYPRQQNYPYFRDWYAAYGPFPSMGRS